MGRERKRKEWKGKEKIRRRGKDIPEIYVPFLI